MHVSRRNFIQSLIATVSFPLVDPREVQDLPPLPVPRHPAIAIPKELRVSFDNWHLGSTLFGDWELNEDGFFVNHSALDFRPPISRSSAPFVIRKVLFQDPKLVWLSHWVDLKEAIQIYPGSLSYNEPLFKPEQLLISPEPLRGVESDWEERREHYRLETERQQEEWRKQREKWKRIDMDNRWEEARKRKAPYPLPL